MTEASPEVTEEEEEKEAPAVSESASHTRSSVSSSSNDSLLRSSLRHDNTHSGGFWTSVARKPQVLGSHSSSAISAFVLGEKVQ